MKKAGLAVLAALAFLVVAAPALAYDYGGQPNLDNSWKGLPVCAEARPKAPILYEPGNPVLPKAKGPGQVRLQWTRVPQAVGYNVYYGLSPKNYIYSAPNLGNSGTDNFTVSGLGNRVYYFAVQTKGSCAASVTSNEWAARPGGGSVTLVAAPGFNPVVTQVPQTAREQVQPEQQGQTTPIETPSVTIPTVPVAPVASAPQGFFQTIFSFFGRLFGR